MRWLALALVLAGCRPAGAPHAVVAEVTHDFGTLPQNTTRAWSAVIRNEGGGTLQIRDVKAECGCTATLLTAKEIRGGGEGRLEVTFLSGHLQNRIEKKITLETNDPRQGEIVLKVIATVTPTFRIDPPDLNMGSVKLGEKLTRTITIEDLQGRRFSVVGTSIEDRDFSVDTRVKTASCHEILVTFAPRDPARMVACPLEIRTDRPEDGPQSVMIQAKAVSPIVVTPDTLTLGYTREGKFGDQKVRVVGEIDTRVNSVVVEPPIFAAKVTPVKDGREYEIALTARPVEDVGFIHGEVRVFVNGWKDPLTVLFAGQSRKE